jgi:hypothetical protein
MEREVATPRGSSFNDTPLSYPKPEGAPQPVVTPDKPYLKGLESEMQNAPRTDPFAEHKQTGKKP